MPFFAATFLIHFLFYSLFFFGGEAKKFEVAAPWDGNGGENANDEVIDGDDDGKLVSQLPQLLLLLQQPSENFPLASCLLSI